MTMTEGSFEDALIGSIESDAIPDNDKHRGRHGRFQRVLPAETNILERSFESAPSGSFVFHAMVEKNKLLYGHLLLFTQP